MIRLRERSAAEAFQFHSNTQPRIYDTDSAQANRILTARRTLGRALHKWNGTPTHRRARIIELGCGMADIGGFFSWGHEVTGYESTVAMLPLLGRRWPWMTVKHGDIQTLEPQDCDFLILCEVLEHLADPEALCRAWLPRCEYALISSPFEEHKLDFSKEKMTDPDTGQPLEDISGSSHIWSFEDGDYERMAESGGHSVLSSSVGLCGRLPIWMGITQRNPAPTV